MAKVNVAKTRVQPANSLQVKFFVARAMMAGELVAVPIFLSRATFAMGLPLFSPRGWLSQTDLNVTGETA